MRRIAALAAAVVVMTAVAVSAQLGRRAFPGAPEHPAIGYATRPVADPVSALNSRLRDATVRLSFTGAQGYLASALSALEIPVESQVLVFSKTSFQAARIDPGHPRALYFNDAVAVGFVRGGPVIEVAAQDARQGVIFYTLDQQAVELPQFRRSDRCLTCHQSYATLDVPGVLARSLYTAACGAPIHQHGGFTSDHRSPFGERWGGWYVTGRSDSLDHMGNGLLADPGNALSLDAPGTLRSLEGRVDTSAYLSPHSDIVALMVFEHQMRMMNLITRVGWEFRYAASASPDAAASANLRDGVNELVDYLLFADEALLPAPIGGSSGFAGRFAAAGPRDRRGRSLRDLDLRQRLMRYPCSYMIYSDAFDGLPADAKEAIYRRMWTILSGQAADARYRRFSAADRRAVQEILLDTKRDLRDVVSLNSPPAL